MKKTIKVLIVVILCTMLVVGCTGGKIDESKSATTSTQTEKKEEVKPAAKEEVVKETKDEVKEEPTKEGQDPTPEEEAVDMSLTDLALLHTMAVKLPDAYITTTVSSMADGSESTTLMYSDGDNYRMESTTAESGTQVVIYNLELGETYIYSVEEASGMISKDDEEEMIEDRDFEGTSYADMFEEEEEPNLKASIVELDGEKVIYIYTFSEEGDVKMEVHNWYDMDYMVGLKNEIYVNGVLSTSSVVTDVQINPEIDPEIFEKPEGITLIEMPF